MPRFPALLTCLLPLVLAACGEAPAGPATDATADVAPLPGFGEACVPATGCAAGLDCQQSEYSPFAWCTRACSASEVKDFCDETQLGGRTALCIQMPAGWSGPAEPFCAPLCTNKAGCKALADGWEVCAKPAYKNKALYDDLPSLVCQAPSAHGQIVVDPVTCDWEAKITDPLLNGAKSTCKAYCQFLTACQLFDPKAEAPACCTWRCFQRITPGGNVDAKLEAETKCFVKSFQAFQNTPQVCTGYLGDCGPVP